MRIWCNIASMKRQSISFSEPNDEWLKAQIDSQEFASKSEVVNDLIRQARRKQQQDEWVRAQLIKGEQSGFIKVTDKTSHEILAESKAKLRANGKL